MSNTEVEKLLESIVSTRQFEQWRSEMLFYISESVSSQVSLLLPCTNHFFRDL